MFDIVCDPSFVAVPATVSLILAGAALRGVAALAARALATVAAKGA